MTLAILQATWQLWPSLSERETITQSQLIGLFVTTQFIINHETNKTQNGAIFAKIKYFS